MKRAVMEDKWVWCMMVGREGAQGEVSRKGHGDGGYLGGDGGWVVVAVSPC